MSLLQSCHLCDGKVEAHKEMSFVLLDLCWSQTRRIMLGFNPVLSFELEENDEESILMRDCPMLLVFLI